jgi:glycosyltransferase involved in cell wall biosynthesis
VSAVSVVIPTYNYAHFLPQALESALAQSFHDIDVWVIDDASTDDTAEVVRPYLKDPRVRYRRIEHAGLAGARNAGVRMSAAPLVALLDADDIWLPHKLQLQLPMFDGRPDVGVVYARRLLMDPDGEDLPFEQPVLFRGRVLSEVFLNNFVCASSAIIRRSVFDRLGLFDDGLPMAEDYELWLRVATQYAFEYVDEPLLRYRTGHTSLSKRDEGGTGYTALMIMRRFLDERGGRTLLPPALVRQAFAETYVHIGLLRRRRSRLAALGCHLQALWHSPLCPLAWKSLASLALPQAGRRWLRRALGRPRGWDDRPHAGGR